MVIASPPGASVTYQMQLQLPADDDATGPAKFGWLMQGLVGPSAAEVLEITN